VPEYRKVRAEAGSFLDLCYAPMLAAEVTLQPIRRFGFEWSGPLNSRPMTTPMRPFRQKSSRICGYTGRGSSVN
jgi:hypothetical protein